METSLLSENFLRDFNSGWSIFEIQDLSSQKNRSFLLWNLFLRNQRNFNLKTLANKLYERKRA